MSADRLDGAIGEAWSGEVPNGSHVNVVVARRGTPTAAAAAGVLASPSATHVPILVCAGAGNLVRPATVLVNRSPLAEERHRRIFWGAAQIGVAQGVLDAVADGAFAGEALDDLVLLVAVWADPEAADETAVRLANRDAVRQAIADALGPTRAGRIDALVRDRDGIRNAYYGGD